MNKEKNNIQCDVDHSSEEAEYINEKPSMPCLYWQRRFFGRERNSMPLAETTKTQVTSVTAVNIRDCQPYRIRNTATFLDMDQSFEWCHPDCTSAQQI